MRTCARARKGSGRLAEERGRSGVEGRRKGVEGRRKGVEGRRKATEGLEEKLIEAHLAVASPDEQPAARMVERDTRGGVRAAAGSGRRRVGELEAVAVVAVGAVEGAHLHAHARDGALGRRKERRGMGLVVEGAGC